jgi:hypothetical protein
MMNGHHAANCAIISNKVDQSNIMVNRIRGMIEELYKKMDKIAESIVQLENVLMQQMLFESRHTLHPFII